MAFIKKTWKDRVSQYINRRLLTDSDGNTQQVTVTRDEGSVTEAGDAFSAANMNDLEDRIEDAFDGLTAADIPYSAGVSVADKLTELSTVSSGWATLNTSYIDGGSIAYYRYGRIVVVDINARFKASVPTDTIVASNMPTSTATMHFLIGQGGNIYRGYLESGGTIKFSDVPPNGYCTGMFVYIASV